MRSDHLPEGPHGLAALVGDGWTVMTTFFVAAHVRREPGDLILVLRRTAARCEASATGGVETLDVECLCSKPAPAIAVA